MIARHARVSALFPALFLLTAPTPARAQWRGLSTDSLERLVSERVARGGSAGLIVGLVESGVPRFVTAGRRAGPASPLMDAETVLEIGSISKVFTALLLAEMVGRSEVKPDDPVRLHLPSGVRVPMRNGREITVLDLATHTSGLPRLPVDFTPPRPSDPYADYHQSDLFTSLGTTTLSHDPGTHFEYSNFGAGLLGVALAHRGGRSYESLVRERILEPLGMRETHIALPAAMQARLATGHGADLEETTAWQLSALAGAGGWRSTPRDMARFIGAVLTPPPGVLGEAIRRSLLRERVAAPDGMLIGLGWMLIASSSRSIAWHNGETGGFHAFVGIDTRTGANVVVLSNSAIDIDDIGFHVLTGTSPLRVFPPQRATVSVPEETLQRYVGEYELAPGFTLVITRAGSALHVQATDQPRFKLHAASGTRFFLTMVEAEVSFTIDAAGMVTGVVLHQGGRESPGRRVR